MQLNENSTNVTGKAASQPLAIEVQNLQHGYGKGRIDLKIKNWQLQHGSHVFLHGESGSGKTTFLNLIAGILTPQAGEVRDGVAKTLSRYFTKICMGSIRL